MCDDDQSRLDVSGIPFRQIPCQAMAVAHLGGNKADIFWPTDEK